MTCLSEKTQQMAWRFIKTKGAELSIDQDAELPSGLDNNDSKKGQYDSLHAFEFTKKHKHSFPPC